MQLKHAFCVHKKVCRAAFYLLCKREEVTLTVGYMFSIYAPHFTPGSRILPPICWEEKAEQWRISPPHIFYVTEDGCVLFCFFQRRDDYARRTAGNISPACVFIRLVGKMIARIKRPPDSGCRFIYSLHHLFSSAVSIASIIKCMVFRRAYFLSFDSMICHGAVLVLVF